MRLSLFYKILLQIAMFANFATAQESDIERLREPFAPDVERPKVILYPLIDQRCLISERQEGTSSLPPEDLSLWEDFLQEFNKNSNLKISSPAETRDKIANNKSNKRSLEAIRKLANRAYADYREVRLEAAIESLRGAADGFYDIEHHLIEPREVARLTLTLGLAHLELGDLISAADAFKEALNVDPCLRLRAGYDHPAAVELFEQVRTELAREPAEPRDFAQRSPSSSFILRSRMLPDGTLSVVLQSSAGVSFDQAHPSPSSASRLASRLATCLPFTYNRKSRKKESHFYIDGGFSNYFFLNRPIEIFNNLGLVANTSWLIDHHIGLDLRLGLFNSSRDQKEDLRHDLPSFRVAFGPSFQFLWSRIRLFTSVGIEIAHIGELITTSNAACKYFSSSDPVPNSICNFDVDLSQSDASTHIGANLAAGFAFSISNHLYTGLRAEIAWYSYETVEKDLGWPIGGQIFMGYRIF